MALPSTTDLINASAAAYNDGGVPNSPTSTLTLLKVDGKPLTLRNDADGFFGAAYKTQSGQVIIAFEGTDLGSFDDNPKFAAAQVIADGLIYLGIEPDAYDDALAFTRTAIAAARAQGVAADDIVLSGHSLGAAQVQYVAAQLDIAGETYGGPGIPASSIPDGQTSELVNYVEYGDPVGNYNADPNPLGDFLYSDQIVRFGSATYLGEKSDRGELRLAGSFFGPGTDDADHLAGYLLLADAAYDHHLLTHYAQSLNINLGSASSAGSATPAEIFAVLQAVVGDKAPVYGGADDDRLVGTASSNAVRGGAGDDAMFGRAGNDRMFGNDGADKLIGGLGRDLLTGGDGADTFSFNGFSESSARKGWDTVLDFSRAEHDRIDLRAVDANTKLSGNQAFHLIGDDAFGHRAGELQVKATANGTLVRGDVNGDGNAEFALFVQGVDDLHRGDILL